MRTQNQSLAKSLRHHSTEAEKKLWRHLRNRQLADQKFRRQQPYGRYILDFYCATAKLVIELDGDSHGTPQQAERDIERDAFLRREGLHVMRFWNFQVMHEFDTVLEVIYRELQRQPKTTAPHPNPLPQRGEGIAVRNLHSPSEARDEKQTEISPPQRRTASSNNRLPVSSPHRGQPSRTRRRPRQRIKVRGKVNP